MFIKGRGILEIGDDVIINSNHVFNPIGGQGVTSIVVDEGAKLLLGSQVGISNSAFYCTTGITIEDNVLIGGSCKIWDTDFHSLDKNIRGTKYDKGISLPVRIKKNCFHWSKLYNIKRSYYR
ncbi:LbetaH domain-containing protein [Formosa algae]|uniref:hypothetical protein n=1 Tax=Formosa algae TaxID=225843 RepID=UPI000CCEDF69|nr:hypothetical protein [Formosa algae]PNW26692.1 hypothetical protein BKP44_16000 [Formosa algae]